MSRPEKTCIGCGDPCWPKTVNASWCSPECLAKVNARWQREAAEREEQEMREEAAIERAEHASWLRSKGIYVTSR